MNAHTEAPAQRVVSDEQVAAEGIEIRDVALATIGGGLGSFALVDRLRVGGVPASDIAVVSPYRDPAHMFSVVCRNSGLQPEDRLRSDSSARIDNLWGFPGYALEQAMTERSLAPMLKALGEPVLTDHYRPTVGRTEVGIAREGKRIGWTEMVVRALAEHVMKRREGGYWVLCRPEDKPVALRCRHLHLALGAAGLQLSPETEDFRDNDPLGDRVVHSYERHDRIYDELAWRGGHVLVRGTGIAASRVLQRLVEVRDASGQDIHIWHLFGHYTDQPGSGAQPDSAFGFRHQAFDFPKAAFGGQLRDLTRGLPEDERIELIRELGATSTPYVQEWAEALQRGRREGWYDAVVGTVSSFQGRDQKVVSTVALANGEAFGIPVDYVVDATGLDTSVDQHRLVSELVHHSGVTVNELGGLRVDHDCCVVGGESGDGLMFASGMTAQGGSLGPVDSFLGLQSAALSIGDVLATAGLGHRLTPMRSAAAWMRWMRGRSL